MTTARAVRLFFFLAALGLLIVLLRRVGWSQIAHALAQVGFGGALLLYAIGTAETMLDSLALSLAIGQHRWHRVFFISNAGALLNGFLPFDLGELAKAALTHKTFPGGSTIAGSIIWNYVFKISRPLVALASALVGFFGASYVDAKIRYLIVAGVLVSFLPYVVLRLLLRQGVAARLMRLLRIVRVLRRDPDRIIAKALEVDQIVAGFWQRRRRAFVGTLMLQICARLVSWLGLLATLRLIGVPIGITDCALLYGALNTAEVLITLIPARLGVSEGAAFGIFKMLNMSPQTGVVMYVVFRLRGLATTGLMAPFAFLPMRPAVHAAAAPPSSPSGADDQGKAPGLGL
jgi:hypothetical protein